MPRAAILPRRRPRTPSPAERRLGTVLMLLLALVFALFLASGMRPGPAVLSERVISATLAGERGVDADAAGLALPAQSPGGWPRGEIERYGADTLFEKINGKADGYLSYGFAALTFASYGDPVSDETYVDVYVYEMSSPLDALGVYRAQRSGGEPSLGAGEESADRGGALFLRQGVHYVEILASGEPAVSEARRLATSLASELEPSAEPVTEPRFFPQQGLRIVRFVRRGALGVEKLSDAFVALYDDGVRLVVAEASDGQSARSSASDAEETFEFLGDPARFVVEGTRILGVVGVADAARRDALLATLSSSVAGGR